MGGPTGLAIEGPLLRRALSLWDLIVYGAICISPMAPMTFFGILTQRGNGHAATAILVAMLAMMLTAISYGRMARAYPSAGSAFTYVGEELHRGLRYASGWSMLMEYVLHPAICTIWCSKAAFNFLPAVPYYVWVVFFALLFI